MTLELVAPAVLAFVAGSVGGWLRRRLPPRLAVLLLTVIAVGAAAAVVWGLGLVAIGGVIGSPAVLSRFGWCERVLRAGHQAPPVFASVATAVLVLGVVRGFRFGRGWRRTLRSATTGGGVTVVDVSEPVAFSLPASGGIVVVSRSLLQRLTSSEQAALFAHEHCHLDRRHHRFLYAAGLAGAVVPLVAPLARHVRFATEREADEAAAATVGDRATVARAIAAAAIGREPGGARLAMAAHAVVQRVEELLRPRRAAWIPVVALVAAVAANVVVLSSSTVQLHHLVTFAAHVCGFDR